MRSTALRLILCFISVAFLTVSANAQATIKVIVNDKAITSYDISQRAKLITLTQRKSRTAAKRMAEQELIDEIIQVGEAARVGMTPSQTEIDNAYANVARNVKMSTSQLSTALRRSGVSPDTLKDRIKAQIAWQNVIRARFRSEIKINESDVIAAMKRSNKGNDEDQKTSIEYELSQVIVVVPKKASNALKSQRKRESLQIQKSFNGCKESGNVLGQYNEVVIKNVGRRLETELPPQMKEEISKLEVGRLTKPTSSGRGFEMIAVCGKREMQSDLAARTEVENELRAKEGEQMSRRYMRQLKQIATIIHR
jgi:peptidyl-prolyl cis-trans isomerase SurA